MSIDRLGLLAHDDARDDDLIVPVDKGPGKGEGGINVSALMRRITRLEAQRAGAVDALQRIASDDCMIAHGETGGWIDTGAPQRIAQDALDHLGAQS